MSSSHITTYRRLSAVALVVSLALLGSTLAAESAEKPETREQKFLRIISTAPEATIRQTYDLDADLVQKIMAYRQSGKTFSTLKQFIDVSGMNPVKAFNLAEGKQPGASGEKPIPPPQPREPQRSMPTGMTVGEDEKTPLVSNIRPGFYGKLPGYDDLESLDPLIKKEFLERMNYEKCPCGCENETLAFCLVNDPGCPVVKARARKLYEEITAKAPPKEPQE